MNNSSKPLFWKKIVFALSILLIVFGIVLLCFKFPTNHDEKAGIIVMGAGIAFAFSSVYRIQKQKKWDNWGLDFPSNITSVSRTDEDGFSYEFGPGHNRDISDGFSQLPLLALFLVCGSVFGMARILPLGSTTAVVYVAVFLGICAVFAFSIIKSMYGREDILGHSTITANLHMFFRLSDSFQKKAEEIAAKGKLKAPVGEIPISLKFFSIVHSNKEEEMKDMSSILREQKYNVCNLILADLEKFYNNEETANAYESIGSVIAGATD